MRSPPWIPAGLGAVAASVSAGLALLVAGRAVLAVEASGPAMLVGLPAWPAEVLGLRWSRWAVGPTELQADGLDRFALLAAALLLCAVTVAVLNAVVLAVEAAWARGHELSVRSALGARPRTLVLQLARDLCPVLPAAGALGLVAGLAAGGALRAGWPALRLGVAPMEAAAELGLASALVAGLVVAAHALAGWRTREAAVVVPTLAAGRRASADGSAVFVRRVASVTQSGLAGAVLIATLALLPSALPAPAEPAGEAPVAVVVSRLSAPSTEAPEWGALLARLGSVRGLAAESLASEGTLSGLGIRDRVLADCGACSRGGLPVRLWGAWADHHAVAPDYFRMAGQRLVAGRAIRPDDGPDAPRVAIVNQTFARTSFEDGEAVGRRVRVGAALDSWYTVVGIVADARTTAVGRDEHARETVYLSALQHPPRRAELLLRGAPDAVADGLAILRGAGLQAEDALPLAELRRADAAPLRWMSAAALALGGIALLLALHGAHATALQITRHRRHELAVRRALGASPGRIVREVLRSAAAAGLAATAVALFVGPLLVAVLRQSAGGIGPLPWTAYVWVMGLLVAASAAASLRAAREAGAVEPAAALE